MITYASPSTSKIFSNGDRSLKFGVNDTCTPFETINLANMAVVLIACALYPAPLSAIFASFFLHFPAPQFVLLFTLYLLVLDGGSFEKKAPYPKKCARKGFSAVFRSIGCPR